MDTKRHSVMYNYAHIVGWGMAVPENIVTNDDLAKIVDTSDEWIQARTGIKARRIATEKETTASLAITAARTALDRARIHPTDVDLVIVSTLTPEHIMPSTASLVQDALGAKNAGAFDLIAGCTGFVYALSMGSAMIQSGQAQVVVIIGAETMSRLVDWQDRSTCVLFGDGAGAVVLNASEEPGGVMGTFLGSDGAGGEHLIVPAGGSKLPTSIKTVAERQHFMKMNGPEVFRFATRVMGKAAKETCQRAGIDLQDIDLFIPHQANARIIKSAAKYLKLDSNKVYKNLDKYGNTSSASIPIALCEAITEGKVKNGDNLVFVGFGGGLTWGATVVRWGLPVPYQERQSWYRALRWAYYRWANLVSKVGWSLLKLEGILSRRRKFTVEEDPLIEQTPAVPVEESPPPQTELADTPPNGKTAQSHPGQNGHNSASANGTLPVEIPSAEDKVVETESIKES